MRPTMQNDKNKKTHGEDKIHRSNTKGKEAKKYKRKFLSFGGAGIRFKFARFSLMAIVVLSIINAGTSVIMFQKYVIFTGWGLFYFAYQLTFVLIALVFLMTLFHILKRGFGVVSRIERMLDQIANGEYSLRIYVRKKDLLSSLTKRINRILDLLENKKAEKKADL